VTTNNAKIHYLNQHNRIAESEVVAAKLKAAVLRIPQSPSYEPNIFGLNINRHRTAKSPPSLPDGPPIPDDQ